MWSCLIVRPALEQDRDLGYMFFKEMASIHAVDLEDAAALLHDSFPACDPGAVSELGWECWYMYFRMVCLLSSCVWVYFRKACCVLCHVSDYSSAMSAVSRVVSVKATGPQLRGSESEHTGKGTDRSTTRLHKNIRNCVLTCPTR